MNGTLSLVSSAAWPVLWMTTVYSYASCGIVGTRAAMQKRDVDAAVDKFILSPFYQATFFSLFTVLYYSYANKAIAKLTNGKFFYALAIGLCILVGHLVVEVLESTVFRRDPLRILKDKDALMLTRVYLVIITMSAIVLTLNN